MSIMDLLDDFVFGPFNLIDRAEGLLSGIRYGDLGHQFAIPRADKGGPFTLAEIEDLLARYGVAVYGRTHDANRMYFHVKKRQARWAEYLMLHAGVELCNATVDERNPGYAASHKPGWMPRPWSQADDERAHPAQAQPTGQKEESKGFTGIVDWLNRL
jgi:hypothetical protein